MPNPDDILPKEAWTDLSGSDQWPKPVHGVPKCAGTRNKNTNGAINLMPIKPDPSPSKNSRASSPIYVNLELDNFSDEENTIAQYLQKGDENRTKNISKPSTKPKPVPRRRSSIRSVGSYDSNNDVVGDNHPCTFVNNRLLNESSICVPLPEKPHSNDKTGYSPKRRRHISNNISNNKGNYHENGSAAISSDLGVHLPDNFNIKTQGQRMMIEVTKELPPLPKQRATFSSSSSAVKSFGCTEMEKNKKSGRNKSHSGWKKNTNGNKQATLVESLELFGSNNENGDSLHTSDETETTKSTEMFVGLKEIDEGKGDFGPNSFDALLANNKDPQKSRKEKYVMKGRTLNDSSPCSSSSSSEN